MVPLLKEHFQKSFMELGEVGATIAAIEFYLSKNLGVIYLLAKAPVTVLDKARCKNDSV